jgi:uncharacterized protein Smg (DUF494 family)
MKEKLVQLLVHIMSELQSRVQLNEIDFGELKRRGYTQAEITEALSWLHENMRVTNGAVTIPARSSGASKRVLHDVEKMALSLESQGYLIQLRELGLIDDHDLEAVIERAVLTGYDHLSIVEVREIVASVLLGKEGSGRRPLLSTNDTVN